ncbi:MAG: VWA domain-containing protein [Phycisphaerales bacterium]|nr:MAG: VWA domain-containing protein [Phycisphaerales bacterium]
MADVLPVRFSQEVQRRDPSTTLVVIIDTSGSMGGPRVNLAKEIARLATARLKPHDKVGIVEFYGSKRWAAPIQPASNSIDLHRALNRLQAGGGTVILPAIEEAYYALRNVRTRTKHVLVLTDGGVEPGAFEPLIRKMADNGTTLSTVMVGPGGHSAFLARLAQWGRGRFYAAPDRFNLPEIIVKQPETSLLTPFVEQPTTLIPQKRDPTLDGIDFADAPPLAAYVETQARPTADVLLRSGLGHPILVRWRFGTGAVAAYATHIAGQWSAELTGWAPYARMMSGLVRSLWAPVREQALGVDPILRPGAVEVQVSNGLPGTDDSFSAVELTLTDSSGQQTRQVLDPIAPNRWNVRLTGLTPGAYRVAVRTVSGRLAGAGALSVPPMREVTALEPDRTLLDSIAAMQKRADQRAAELSQAGAARPVAVRPVLLGATIALFVLNVLIRRWPLRRRRSAAPAIPMAVAVLVGCLVASPARAQDAGGTGARAAKAESQAAKLSGRLEEARATLAKISPDHPNDARLWTELAQLEELLGNDAAAVAALDRSIAAERGEDTVFALGVRRAMILYDRTDTTEAAAAIKAIAAARPDDPDVAAFCAHVAALSEDYETALDLLRPSGEAKRRFHEHLLRGLCLSLLGRPRDAGGEYEQAYRLAPLSRDRRFAVERIIACARESGELNALADRWLADPELPADRLGAIVPVLRELGRPGDALTLLDRPDATGEQKSLIESSRFQSELIAVAVEAGRTRDAEAAYRALLSREPEQVEWRIGLARLKLLEGRRDEAGRIFSDRIEQCDDAQHLMSLAEGARRLGLDDAALRAARKAGDSSRTARRRAVLFEADLARERGDVDEAIALLKRLKGDEGDDPNAILQVAEAFERYGDKQEALRLLRKLYDTTRSEDVLLRVAWLLEENGRFTEAFALWKDLWQTTQVPARLRQAQERVLDLASRTGQLADLAIELEEWLDEAPAQAGGVRENGAVQDDRRLSLLVDIYTFANDPVSAAEILQEFARRSQQRDRDSIDLLKRLARVYLRCEQFGRCNGILRRLVALDPANADEYLQQIAVVALERRQPHQAKAALAELSARAGDDPMVDEFSAGVLDMIGLHEEAARAYDRVLARHPDRIEAFLMWGNAMKAAGKVDQAIGRFQVLAEQAAEDDLFAVAVDGLLNLDAKPVALQSAYRRVLARIAAWPDKVFLYRLGADLLEAMGRPADRDTLLEKAVIVAGERRGPLLRELLDAARTENKTARMIRFGRSLLALDEEMPPQVYLDLGQALIKEGQLVQAERVFSRASVGGDFSAVQQRVATCFDEANRPADANRIIRELLVAEPDNVTLLIRSGGLCEQLGAFDRAFEQYDRAADLMLRRLPRVVRRDEAGQDEASADASHLRRRRWRAANLDEVAQYFQSAGNGLLNAARTAVMRDRLLQDVKARVTEEIQALDHERSFALTIDGNMRLDRLAAFLRHVAFCLRAPDVADEIDRMLLALYPSDRKFMAAVVQARIDWGLYARAVAFQSLVAGNDVQPPAVLTVDAILSGDASPDDMLTDGRLTAATGCRLVPALIMAGRDDDARRLLLAMPPGPAPEVGDTASTMIAAAVALDDYDALRRWLTIWLDACRKLSDADAVADNLERCVRLVWNHLTPGDQTVLVERMNQAAGALESDDRLPVDLLRMRLAQGMDLPFDGRERVLAEAATDNEVSIELLARLLDAAPSADRPGLVRAMVLARKPDDVREVLMKLAGRLRTPADALLAETFENLIKAAPPKKYRPDRMHSEVRQGGWNRNPSQPEIGRRIGEILLGEMPNELAVLVATAAARNNAGQHDQAMLLVGEAVDLLLSVNEPGSAQSRMWDDLTAVMEAADCREIIADLTDRADIEGVTPSLLYGKGVMLLKIDRQADAVDAFIAAFELSPGNRTLSRSVIRLLKESGRERELAHLLSTHLTRSSIMESYEWRTLTVLYCNLYDPLAAAQAARQLEGPLGPVEIMRIARMMGKFDEVRAVFRRFLITNRNQGRFYNLFWPQDPAPGGMVDYLTSQKAGRRKRHTMFTGIADLPFAQEEFAALLQAAPPDRRDVPGLVDGLARATQSSGTREPLIADLVRAHGLNALTAKDRRTIIALVENDATTVPEALAGSLDGLPTYLDPTDFEDQQVLWAIARFHRAAGRIEHARNILRWLVAYDLLTGPTSTRVDERFERLDDYLTVVPETHRQARRSRWMDFLAPTPLSSPSAAFVDALLERWATVSDPVERDRRRQELRKRLQADPSEGALWYALIARCEAAAGDLDAFAASLTKVFSAVNDRGGALAVPLDLRKALPPARDLDNPTRYVDAVASGAVSAGTSGTLSRTGVTRGLCLLGQWCVDNGLLEHAKSILARAEEMAGSTGEHSLWLADLARATGDHAKALAIEVELLQAESLPVTRVSGLLDAVESHQGQEKADALAVRVAAYSDHPEVLRRAIRGAATAGDPASASDYRERLQVVAPSQPTVTTTE